MKKYLFSVLLFIIAPFGVYAQENQVIEADSQQFSEWAEVNLINDGQVDCFDYYRFQSVQVSMDTDFSNYKDGDKIIFEGQIINKNDYPVIDGNVFVRISRKNTDYLSEGHNIVDEFIALENVSLSTKEIKDVQFTWQIPYDIKEGQYIAEYFFSVGKKFNLGGLPFSNEIIIGSSDFQIESDTKDVVEFNRAKTTLNDEKYNHIGDTATVNTEEEVSIKQTIDNSFPEDKQIEVLYEVYFWDSLNEKDKIKEEVETLTIPASSSKEIKYVVKNINKSVYYVKMTIFSQGNQSIINTRFATDVA